MSGDWCTTKGAERLRQKIEQYWVERGYKVNIDLIEAGFVAAMRSGRTDVRSDLINGMPKRKVGRETSDMSSRSAARQTDNGMMMSAV